MMSKTSIVASITTITLTGSLLLLKEKSNSAMRESPDIAASHNSNNNNTRIIFNANNIKQLKDEGYIIFDNVLSSKEIEDSRNDILLMLTNKTKLKFYQNDNNDDNIRKDKVSWISESIGLSQHQYCLPGLLLILRILRSLPLILIQNEFEIDDDMGVPLSNQLSVYHGSGNNYVAHLDKPNTKSTIYTSIMQSGLHDRKYTIILYLNSETWTSDVTTSDGVVINDNGVLRITKLNGETIDVSPIGGRCVMFDSSKILHEVRPNYGQDRIALTCWIGGSHSTNKWLQLFNIPIEEYNWKHIFGF